MQYILTQQDIFTCRKSIQDLDDDNNGLISIYDFQTVLQRLQIHFQQFQLCKLISQLDINNKGYIEFQNILHIYKKKRQQQLNADNDQVTLDAYTAIGGPVDKSGHIDANVLVRIIKKQFELPIDIQQLIRQVDDSGNGEIQYEEFQKMMKSKNALKLN